MNRLAVLLTAGPRSRRAARNAPGTDYKLYRNQTACDTDDWGRPRGRFATLADAMAAAGHPDPSDWQPGGIGCPDEAVIDGKAYWSIIARGASAEVADLKRQAVA